MSEAHSLDDTSRHGAAPGEESSAFTLDYRRIWETAKKFLWLIILYIIAGVVAAVVYLSNATPIYRSVARVKVEQRVMTATPNVTGSAIEEDLRGLEMLQTIQLGFVSRSLMERMVERMNLVKREDFYKSTGLEKNPEPQVFAAYLLGNTKADLIQGTRLMTISFDHPDPQVATEVVNTLIKEFISLEGEQRLAAASVNLSYLIEERKSLEEKLQQSRNKLIEYTRKLGSVSVEGEVNIVAGQLVELNSRLGAAKADRLRLESDYELIKKLKGDTNALLSIGSVSQLPQVQTLRSQLSTVDAELSKARERYLPSNPMLVQLRSQRDAIQRELAVEVARAPESIQQSLDSATKTEQALQKATTEQEKRLIENKALSIESQRLQGEIDADNIAYQAVLRKLNDETSQARSQPVFIQVVDPASPAFRVKPKPVQVVAIALFAAVALSAVTIFVLATMDTSFKSVDELESYLGLQVLAAVPKYETTEKKKKGEKGAGALLAAIPLTEDPYSAASEAYRTLRASLLLLEDDSHSILVTSAVPEEGKSTTSLNLAVAMAQRGARTLLIEADLRKPVLEQRFFGTQNSKGLAEFLSDKAEFDEIVRETPVPNLFIICAGKVSRSSGELVLRRHRVEKLLQRARADFAQVVMDSAPLLAVSDSLTLAKHFKTIALVVRSHKTPRRMVRRAADLLRRSKRVPVGAVLSMVPPGSDYYYYGYSQAGRAYGAERHTTEVS